MDDWQKLRVTEDTVHQWFNGEAQNIGVRLGGLSGGLADVDLDSIEAIRAAPYFLLRTQCFGRPSKPRAPMCGLRQLKEVTSVGSLPCCIWERLNRQPMRYER
jgi:hypothetical protein